VKISITRIVQSSTTFLLGRNDELSSSTVSNQQTDTTHAHVDPIEPCLEWHQSTV
jgi:hypothetical protein